MSDKLQQIKDRKAEVINKIEDHMDESDPNIEVETQISNAKLAGLNKEYNRLSMIYERYSQE